MQRITTLLWLLLFISTTAGAQDFMMQGWYWDYTKPNCNNAPAGTPAWATRLAGQAGALGQAGFTHVWLPPLARASFGSCSNGYDPKDLYDLGEYGLGPTSVGTRAQVDAMIGALAANGINSVADVVYNHRDGGAAEDNPAVKAYIETHFTTGKAPFPSDRYRYRLPLGGTYGAGSYYIKISSKTQSYGPFTYKFYATVAGMSRPFQGSINENEPNGGGDCGQPSNTVLLDQDLLATLYDFSGCYTDEFRLDISAADFQAGGDDLLISLTNPGGGYSDHRIYGIYYQPANGNGFSIDLNDLKVQTYTDFTSMPSGQGGMNFENFRPNSTNTSTTFMSGDYDSPLFFYDVVQENPSTLSAYADWTEWLFTNVGVTGLRMDAVKHFPPFFVAQILDELHNRGITPDMVVGEVFDGDPGVLADWVNQVNANIVNSQALVRVFDFSLRNGLKEACDYAGYDARNLFNASLTASTNLEGFSAVTFVNNHDFRGPGEPIQNNALLAYAYILTNNDIGIPTVFYPDFFGTSIPHAPVNNLQAPISQLMQLHRDHIFGSPNIEYLNRFGSPRVADYQFGGPQQGVIYQMQGGVGSESVIVAVNFGYSTLKVDHEIALSSQVNPGTVFTDQTGRAFQPTVTVSGANRLLIDVPARNYAVYTISTPNTNTILPAELTDFTARLRTDRAVEVFWQTSQEEGVSHFELEVSSDGGRIFAPLHRTAAANQPATYAYHDRTPWPNGKSRRLYRLRTVDLDGSEETGPLRSVEFIISSKEAAYPNPTDGPLFLPGHSDAGWQLYRTDGQRVRVKSQAGPTGIILDLSGLPAGLYWLRTDDGHVAGITVR